jgi:hypothetical protein
MTPEGKIEAYLKKRVLESGGRIRKLKWIGTRGAPDRLVWWPRTPEEDTAVEVHFVEVKAPGKKPTKQQQREHDRLKRDGFYVKVIDSKDAVDVFVELDMLYGRDPE